MQPARSPESTAFQECFADLCSGVQSVETLIINLYAKGVLSKDRRDEIQAETNPAVQRRKFVAAVEEQVNQNPQIFHIFLDLLEREAVMQPLCTSLKSSLGEPAIIILSILCMQAKNTELKRYGHNLCPINEYIKNLDTEQPYNYMAKARHEA